MNNMSLALKSSWPNEGDRWCKELQRKISNAIVQVYVLYPEAEKSKY